ncbi:MULTISPECIES: hypothetical protein [unclassified Novosphingobium]|uniref:hypothetical protein n=1 Tax=unclassified Novosphingobium TaxID=2644732 RepID=UPI000EBFCF81|nr:MULTISPECIES: hypothetical protein [unclassified Novosphingobium]HCF24716.1 hypothetical protein [Novosphingobium sp.]HQV02075.1 hypothetical protein [Novosphingobium sp.]
MNLSTLPWHEPGGAPAAQVIGDFLLEAGFDVAIEPIEGATFLPGLAVDQGRLVIDPAVPSYPGDLLHEAGHLAVLDPERRGEPDAVTADGGDEMAAIAWSVAAARACNVPLEVLFHPHGYKGGSDHLIETFKAGQPFGVPLLAWWGLTTSAEYPAMQRWMR